MSAHLFPPVRTLHAGTGGTLVLARSGAAEVLVWDGRAPTGEGWASADGVWLADVPRGVGADAVGALPLLAAVEVGVQLAERLAALHAEGRVHGTVDAGSTWLDGSGLHLPPPVGGEVGDDLRGLAAVLEALVPEDDARMKGLIADLRAGRVRTAGAAYGRLVRARLPPGRGRVTFRPGAAWLVVADDPLAGRPGLVLAGVSSSAARAARERLVEQGWRAEAFPEALGGRQVLIAFTLALVLSPLVSPFGGVLIGGTALAWFAGRLRPDLRALPPVPSPLPPLEARVEREAVWLGLSMLLTAAAIRWWPLAAPVPALMMAVAFARALRWGPPAAEPVADARLATLEAHLRHRLAAPDLELDLGLGALGELDAVLAEHAVGRLAVRDAIGRLEAIERRLDAGPARIAGPTSRAAQQRGTEGTGGRAPVPDP